MKLNNLRIVCKAEPDMEGEWDREEIEEDMRDMMQTPEGNDWIEWVMFHCDVDDYFSQEIIDVVCMPEFKSGTFVVDDVEFTITKW